MANQQTMKLTQKILRHMQDMSKGDQVGGAMLGGDPGIGKTTYVELLGALLGLETVIIEIPHITEEHLINIPFLVFNAATGQKTHGSTSVPAKDTPKMSMTLADSNLFTTLNAAKMMPDAQYLQYMATKAPQHVASVYQAMGGTAEKIPDVIAHARKTHHVILFLDEFYRQSSMRIRNIMRGILNGNIGMHKIPKNVYIMYASNMKDSGLDEQIPGNHQFMLTHYKAPTQKDWFLYMASKYANHAHIKLNPAVMKKFQEILTDDDISYDDVAAGVRTSPRRWEQLISYINTSLPVKSQQEARALITNVKNNFIHYQEETHSDIAGKVTKAVAELIKETSGINTNQNDTLEPHEWRSALDHAITQIERSGGDRKHIPVVSGPPGIGKTSQAWQLAEKHNLRLVEIDVSELFADDVIGMPLPGERKEKGMEVTFSAPKLYQQIMDMIEKKDKAYIEQLMADDGTDAKEEVEKYKKQKFKYLILLDELNRVDQKTFNSLRRVILEKNFGGKNEEDGGQEYKLPKSAIVIGAINPTGAGTEELTSHFRDVIDVIPAKASWNDTKKWLGSKEKAGVDPEVKTVTGQLQELFVKKFADKSEKHGEQQRAFHLDVNGFELYISPREYADMHATLSRELNAKFRELLDDPTVTEDQMRPGIDEAVFEAFEDSLNMIFYKQNADMLEEFMPKLKTWVHHIPDQIYGQLIKKTASGIDSLSNVMGKYLEGHDLTKMLDDIHIVNANDTINHAQFMDEIKQALTAKIVDDASVKKYILEQTHPRISLKGDDLVANGAPTSLLANFFLALLFTLHAHNYANDRLAVVGKALSTMMSDVRKRLVKEGKITEDAGEDASMAVVELRSEIMDAIEAL